MLWSNLHLLSLSSSNVMPTDHSKGIELTPGSFVLNEISKYFDEVSAHDLAGILLEKQPGGGPRFIRRHTSTFGQPDWALMAYKVLVEWCEQSPDKVFGYDLWKALKRVCPIAAGVFHKKLLGTT